MKKIKAQISQDAKLMPFSLIDEDAVKTFHTNQIVDVEIKGIKKPRSYTQLKMYHGCCQVVASNTADIDWNTRAKVDFRVKLACQLFDKVVVSGDKIYFSVGSVSYHMLEDAKKADQFFTDAFQVLASKIGVDIETLKRMYVEQSAS